MGRVYLTDLSDDWAKDPLQGYKVGQVIEGVVVDVNRSQAEP